MRGGMAGCGMRRAMDAPIVMRFYGCDCNSSAP